LQENWLAARNLPNQAKTKKFNLQLQDLFLFLGELDSELDDKVV